MPRSSLPLLSCEPYIADGTIDLRPCGQFNTDMHVHEQGQLLSPAQGILYLYTSHGVYGVPANYYVWIPPGLSHKLVSRSTKMILRTLFLTVGRTCTQQAFFEQIGVYTPSLLVNELLDYCYAHGSKDLPEIERSLLMDSLRCMLPRVFQKKVTLLVSAPYSDLMQQVIQYIEEHLTENISFSDVSQRFNIPERTLARWFKDEIGMSMFQFVKIARIQ